MVNVNSIAECNGCHTQRDLSGTHMLGNLLQAEESLKSESGFYPPNIYYRFKLTHIWLARKLILLIKPAWVNLFRKARCHGMLIKQWMMLN